MENLNYKELYKLQNKVLDIVFKTEKEFYLTGGTCISRFYKGKRYSDDLDFFTNDSLRYNVAVRNIKIALMKNFDLKAEIESKNFSRFIVDKILQVDFVNDTAYRYKDVVITKEGYIIDNIENILSNKITAVMGRNDPKDIFDIYLIAKFYTFSWKDILKSAHKKAYFSDEELIIRLKAFPSELLKNIKLIDKNFLDNFDEEFKKVINDIENEIDNEE